MLISHSHKFIFIHNAKVAGTSITKALKPYALLSPTKLTFKQLFYLLNGNYPRIYSQHFPGHINAMSLSIRLPAIIFKHYYKFGFVRNPWDRQVSYYKYLLRNKSHPQHNFIKNTLNFDDFIDWTVKNNRDLQRNYFFNTKNKCLVNFIGRYENLNPDFKKICNHLGVQAALQRINYSQRNSDFRSYYSKRSIQKIARAFQPDITLFGYNIPS